MIDLSISTLPMIEEYEATEEVAEIYDEIKREMQVPFVPNIMKALAPSPEALTIAWGVYRSFFEQTTLPHSLVPMVLYAIAEAGNCRYCSAKNELTCRTLGIDEETLNALVHDLDSVSPQRIAAIIGFAVKVAHDPQGLVTEDYERVREQGGTDAEIVEVVQLAALGKYFDIIADALKIQVDSEIENALVR
jgi:uncharacterized peroxidase-related enzyme